MSRPRYARDHSATQRDCALYRIRVLDPRTNYRTVCLGYVGETAREPFTRFLEHLYEQPFGDTIVGTPEVDQRVFRGKEEVWAAERAAVEAERPLYNYEWNLANPDRVPIPVARRQREERDRARGVQPAPQRAVSTFTGAVVAAPRAWTRRQRLAAAFGGLWLVLAAATGVAAWHFGAGVRPALVDGTVTSSALLLAGWLCRPVKGVRRQRRRRKWALVLLAGAVAVIGWSLLPGQAPRVPSVPVVAPR